MKKTQGLRRWLAAAGVVLAAGLTVTAAAVASASSTLSIGNCTTEGSFASCSIQGDIVHPASITLKVSEWGASAGKVTVYWDDSCSTSSTFGDRSGHFSLPNGHSHTIPLAAGHTGTCTPSVNGSINGAGQFTMRLSGSRS